jgi:hypothetical protein
MPGRGTPCFSTTGTRCRACPHCSGHGGQERDRTGEVRLLHSHPSCLFSFFSTSHQRIRHHAQELDGFNETLIPLDFKSAGQIVDDEINRTMVNPLPPGARLVPVTYSLTPSMLSSMPATAEPVCCRINGRRSLP